MDVTVRKARLCDVDGIVSIHQAAFRDFFLTTLGEGFLKTYYSAFVKNGPGVVLCAFKDGRMAGFAAASYRSRGFNTRLVRQNLPAFCRVGLGLLFTRPGAIRRLVKNLDKKSGDSAVRDDGEYAELYSIAVSPDHQGEGIGRLLLTATEQDVGAHNGEISLTTDYYDNEKALAFYQALGYRQFYDFTAFPDRRMWRLNKTLSV